MTQTSDQKNSPSQKLSRGHKLSSPAALVALVCFFLPWVMVSCGGQPVGSFTGLDLATGPKVGMGYVTQRAESEPLLFVVPLAALGALALTYMAYKRGQLTALDGIGLIAFGAAPLIVLLLKYTSVQGEAAQAGIRFDAQIGVLGVIIGFICVIVGGVLNYNDKGKQG